LILFQQEYILLAPTLSPVSEIWDSQTLVLLIKTEVKKAFRPFTYSMERICMAGIQS